jgi:hypothetical protein
LYLGSLLFLPPFNPPSEKKQPSISPSIYIPIPVNPISGLRGKAGRERNGTGFIGRRAPHWVRFGHSRIIELQLDLYPYTSKSNIRTSSTIPYRSRTPERYCPRFKTRKRREEEKREGKGMGLDSLGVGLLTGSGLATVESFNPPSEKNNPRFHPRSISLYQ